jgi:hypothetical protein
MKRLALIVGVLVVAASCTTTAAPKDPQTLPPPVFHPNGLPAGVTLVGSRYLVENNVGQDLGHFLYTDNSITPGTGDGTESSWVRYHPAAVISPDGRYATQIGPGGADIVDRSTDAVIVHLGDASTVGSGSLWREDSGAFMLADDDAVGRTRTVIDVVPGAVPRPVDLGPSDCSFEGPTMSWSAQDWVLHSCRKYDPAQGTQTILTAIPLDGSAPIELFRSVFGNDSGADIDALWVPGTDGDYVMTMPTFHGACGVGVGSMTAWPTSVELANAFHFGGFQTIVEPYDASHGCHSVYGSDRLNGWNVANP